MPANYFRLLSVCCLLAALIAVAIVLFWPRQGWLLPALTPQPERFTELYFEDHLNLPKQIEFNTSYPVSFTIHNLEGRQMTYDVQIELVGETSESPQVNLLTQTVDVSANESKTVSIELRVPALFSERARMTVRLVDLDQTIHFWMEVPTYPQPSPSPDADRPVLLLQ